MDIHRPKAAHSIREFAVEIGTIICGILIALGLEQGIEWLHWRHQVETADEALSREVQDNLRAAYTRVAVRPCIDGRIARLRDALLKPADTWEPNTPIELPAEPKQRESLIVPPQRTPLSAFRTPLPLVLAAPGGSWNDGAWLSAVANGVLLHMSAERAEAYALQHRMSEELRDTQARETAAQGRLAALGFKLKISPAERAQYLNVLGEVGRANMSMAVTGGNMIWAAGRAGLQLSASDVTNLQDDLKRSPWGYCLDFQPIPQTS